MQEFWAITEYSTSATVHLADRALQSLEKAELPHLQSVLVQYRWFTGYYPSDLAILVSKLPPSWLRSFAGQLVYEELGSGDPSQAHLALYDAFLDTLGVTDEMLADLTNPNCVAIMESARHKLLEGSYPFAIGLRGMGGECLCQVYLQAMNHYLLRNPIIQELRSEHRLDWRFWDLHAGEADEAHARTTREHIAELVEPGDVTDLCDGYIEAESHWKLFWLNAFDSSAFRTRASFASGTETSDWIPTTLRELDRFRPGKRSRSTSERRS